MATKLPARSHQNLLGLEVAHAIKPTRDYIKAGFREMLHGITLEGFAALLTDDFRDFVEYLELLGNGKTCQRMSLHYNPQRLDTQATRYAGGPTLYEAITTGQGLGKTAKPDSFYDGMARVYLNWKTPGKERNLLYSMIQWGIQGTYYTNEFPPHVARDIYREFHLGPDSRILDPCAGWGGRMIGASTVSNSYVGYEPATKTANGLVLLARRLRDLTRGAFDAKVRIKPFEDSRIAPGTFDLALTSPPYYDTEIYSDEETNSLNRYKTFDDWLVGFYFPFIDKTLAALKPGAPFILNVGDRKYPLATKLREYAEGEGYSLGILPTRITQGQLGQKKRSVGSMPRAADMEKMAAKLAGGGGLRKKTEKDDTARHLTTGESFFIVRRIR